MTIAEITASYLSTNATTAAGMAYLVTQAVDIPRKVYNDSAVYRWLDGSRLPDLVLLKLLKLTASGWLREWAEECLSRRVS